MMFEHIKGAWPVAGCGSILCGVQQSPVETNACVDVWLLVILFGSSTVEVAAHRQSIARLSTIGCTRAGQLMYR